MTKTMKTTKTTKAAYVGKVACTRLLIKNNSILMTLAFRNRISSLISKFSFYRYSTLLSDTGFYVSNMFYLIHCNDKWAIGKSLTDCLLQIYTQEQIEQCVYAYAHERSKTSTTLASSFKFNVLRSIKNFGRAQTRSCDVIYKMFDCELFPVYIDSEDAIASFTLEKLHTLGLDSVYVDTGDNSKNNQINQLIFVNKNNEAKDHHAYVEAKATKLLNETVPLDLESERTTSIEYFDYLKDIIEKEIERRANIRAQEIVQNMLKTLIK